jgi:hypothetical protein
MTVSAVKVGPCDASERGGCVDGKREEEDHVKGALET